MPKGSARSRRAAAADASIVVSNLNDSGPGSFREAVTAKGPRVVVFGVGGLITLESPVAIEEPFVTIAGQTAPGDGICVRGHQVSDQDARRRRPLPALPAGRPPEGRRGQPRHRRRRARRDRRPLLGHLERGREPVAERRHQEHHRAVVPDRRVAEPQRAQQGARTATARWRGRSAASPSITTSGRTTRPATRASATTTASRRTRSSTSATTSSTTTARWRAG